MNDVGFFGPKKAYYRFDFDFVFSPLLVWCAKNTCCSADDV